MNPKKGTEIPRPDIGQAVYETMAAAPTMGFIADLVLPYFRVNTQSGTYPVFPASSLFNTHETRRADGSHYNRVEEQFESGRFGTEEHGLEMPIQDRFVAMYGSLFDYEVSVANILMGKILRAREKRAADVLFNSSNFTAHAASAKWNLTTADPKTDIETGKEALRAKGVASNKLIIAWPTFRNLIKVTKVIDAVKDLFPDTAKTGTIELRHLEAYFDVSIALAGSLANSSKKGQAASLSGIWSDSYAMLCRTANQGDDITEPCVGRTFYWNEGAQEEVIVEEYYEPKVRGMVQRVRHDVSEHLLHSRNESTGAVVSAISKQCGYLFGTIK